MTSYGKIEIMEMKRHPEVFVSDSMLDNRLFAEDNAKISRCIHHPDGMISLSAQYLNAHYELRFMEPTSTESWIKKDHGFYSISNNPLQGTGRVVKLHRFEKPEPFLRFYHIITTSNSPNEGHCLVWRIGIASFSKEVTEEMSMDDCPGLEP